MRAHEVKMIAGPMIKMKEIVKSYGSREKGSIKVLDGLSIEIGKGEFVAVMAPSGWGKTTLLNIMGCLDRPDGGTYFLDGIEPAHLSDDDLARLRNRELGFVFQSYHLLPRLTALENVEVPLLYLRGERPQNGVAIRMLETLGLGERATHLPDQLSGGEQQRVAIARALVNDPELILADEPTGSLDEETGKEIMDILKDLNGRGKTVVVITHDMEVANNATRIVRLHGGRTLEAGA